jgi:alpha/beta superfamily hydrolase
VEPDPHESPSGLAPTPPDLGTRRAGPAVLSAADGVRLEAEVALPPGDARPIAGFVLCHPHPTYGGSMHTPVPDALFRALPARGVACLRFNFRGVGASEGHHTGGRDEPLDVVAALDGLVAAVPAGTPVHLQGWSFGALMALSVADPRVSGWLAVAPPLSMTGPWSLDAVAADPRPKLVVVGRHDQAVDPARLTAAVGTWANARTMVVEGTDHFFAGRTGELVALASEWVGAAG